MKGNRESRQKWRERDVEVDKKEKKLAKMNAKRNEK